MYFNLELELVLLADMPLPTGTIIDPTTLSADDLADLTHLRAAQAAAELSYATSALPKIDRSRAMVGIELEGFSIDANGRAMFREEEILSRLNGGPFVREVPGCVLEGNPDPFPLDSTLPDDLYSKIKMVREKLDGAVRDLGGTGFLPIGTLPSSTLDDCGISRMIRKERTHVVSRNIFSNGSQSLSISGSEGCDLTVDNINFSCLNASLQIHLDGSFEELRSIHDAANLCLAPVLAATSISSVLFGKLVAAEARIEMWQKAFGGRTPFVESWGETILETYKRNTEKFSPLFFEHGFAQQNPQELRLLDMENSTVYPLNRFRHAKVDSEHWLRDELKCMPAWPTDVDNTANVLFQAGLVWGMANRLRTNGDSPQLGLSEAYTNMLEVAANGIGSAAKPTLIKWPDYNGGISVRELIIAELLPLAAAGLESKGIASNDYFPYLQVIDQRLSNWCSGSHMLSEWLTKFRRHSPSAAADKLVLWLTAECQQAPDMPLHKRMD